VARKPRNFEWIGFTPEQLGLLNLIDHVGNNGWARNGQTEALMPNLLGKCAETGLSVEQIMQAMADIGYRKEPLHMLERWESKRTIDRFGK
jgi:hypothetical protein